MSLEDYKAIRSKVRTVEMIREFVLVRLKRLEAKAQAIPADSPYTLDVFSRTQLLAKAEECRLLLQLIDEPPLDC